MLYGPSCSQLIPPAAGATSAACAWARRTSAALTGLAELCLRSRYSSGSALPYGLSASGAWASAPAAVLPAVRVVERVNPNVASVSARTSAPMASPAVLRRCGKAIPPVNPTEANSCRRNEHEQPTSVQVACDRCSGGGDRLDGDPLDLGDLVADRGLELADR